MVTVRVYYRSTGKPASGVKVSLSFSSWTRGVTGNEFTNSDGDAHFDTDPGTGKIFVKGAKVYEGRIEGRTIVYC